MLGSPVRNVRPRVQCNGRREFQDFKNAVCVCVFGTSRERISLWVLVWTKAKLTGNANKAARDVKTTCTHSHKQIHTYTCVHTDVHTPVNKQPPHLCSSVIKPQKILEINFQQKLCESLARFQLHTVTAAPIASHLV